MADKPETARSASIWAALRSFRFSSLLFGVVIPGQVLAQAFISYLVALYLHDLGASTADIGRVLMVFYLMITFTGPATARITEGRFDPFLVAGLGGFLCGIGLLAGAQLGTQLGILVAVGVAGVGQGMMRGPQVSIAMSLAESDLAQLGLGTVLGSLRTLERAGSIVGLIVVALVGSHIGYAAAMAVIGAWVLLGVSIFAVTFAISARPQEIKSGK